MYTKKFPHNSIKSFCNKIDMKRIITLCILLCSITSLKAQDSVYVMFENEIKYKEAVSKIDSVIFYQPDNSVIEPYITTVGEGSDEVKLAVVKGSPYEMGKQLGEMLGNEIETSMGDFLLYAQQRAPVMYSNEELDKAWETNSPYVDPRIIEEMQGMAETSGVSFDLLKRAHMVPLISSYACSGVAVWGNATADGHTYQLRNLDYTMGAGLQNHPLVVVYIPDNGIAHVNVTFAGYIASHTGMNAKGLVLGEKGKSSSSEYPYNIEGVHFSFLFRSLMYDANDLEELLETVESTKLIKRYYLFFSDGNTDNPGGAKVIVSSPDEIKLSIYRDNDQEDNVAPDVLPGAIYQTMDNSTAYSFLTANTGNIDHNSMIELSKAVADEGSNLMNVVYDASSLMLWVAFANMAIDASQQTYVEVDINDYIKN